jgi:hypothetical protein
MTNATRVTAVMSVSGSPSSAMMSASYPAASVPMVLSRPSDRADIDVADTRASIGF